MNPEANYDVSVDYNILNDAITAIKNIKSKCSQLISDLSGVDVSILDSAGEMAAAIATAEGVMDGPVELVLGRIMEVETLFYMMQNQDFFVDLQEAMQSGKFNDENGNLDIAAVMEHIVMNADGRYQDLLEDEDFRRLFVEQNILSVYGISSMEELENVRNGYLDLTRQYESERNGIVYDASHVTRAFMNKLLENNYMFADFDTVAATTIMAYSYVDVNGMEIMVDSLDAVPTEKRNQAKQLSYADLCGDSELYGELKECLNGKASLAAIAFSSGLSDFEAKIDADIEASEVRLAELDNLINGEEGSRTSLMMIDGIVNDVNSRTNHLTNLYGFMINDDFEAMSVDLAGDDVVQAVTDYKNGLFDNFLNFTNNSVDGNDEMNILYSIISGNGEFQTVNGNVVVQKGDLSYYFNSAGDDTLSNYAYWADQMTADEKSCFYYVWNTQGQDAAYDYLQSMSGVLDTRWVLNQREIDSAFASEHKVAASVYSVLANPFEGFSALVYSIKQGINDDNMTRTQVYSHGDTMRQTVSSELASESELAGFAYNVGMSMADNMYSMILTGGNSTLSGMILGVSSYNDSLNDALDRGLTDDQARLFAGASAGVEMLMEKMSIDELLDIKPIKGLMDVDVGDVAKLTDTQKGLKNFFGTLDAVDGYTDDVFQNSVLPKISGIGNSTLRNRTYDMANVIYNGVKQGIGEGNEELATSIAGRIIDDWIADENSSYNISVQSYINQGYTEAEAMAMANSEYRDELITSWLSGAASGTTMGGGQTIRGLVSTDIKVNGMLADYKTNPNYEAQLGELQSNMREGHYDAALTMVVDNSTSYEQGMSDANKLVDSLLNKGMISEEGKTQLNAYLEADAKAHTVLEGTSYETGNNVIRNIIRQDIMNKNVSDDDKYTRGLYLSSFDSGNSQRCEDANKIINNMEQNGIITSEQRDNMLIGVENRRNAVDMIGHLQKGDAAVTLAARKNHTVVTESVPVVSETTSVTDMETQQSTTKSDTSVGSDFAATAGAFGNLGVIASQTGLGAIATAGMDTHSDSDVDPGKPKVYSDERIVIEDDSREAYSQQREITINREGPKSETKIVETNNDLSEVTPVINSEQTLTIQSRSNANSSNGTIYTDVGVINGLFSTSGNVYYGHGTTLQIGNMHLFFEYGLRCSHDQLSFTTCSLGEGSTGNVFENNLDMLNNWYHMNSEIVVVASVPLKYQLLEIIGSSLYGKREAAYYIYYDEVEAGRRGLSPGYYLKPEFILGYYDSVTGEFVGNPNYYENLSIEEQSILENEIYQNYMSILEEFGVEDYREIISDLDYWSIPEMSDGDVPFARNDSSIIDNSDNRISQEIVEETVLENSEEQSVEIFEEQVIENDASYKNFDFDDDIDWDDGSFDSDINLTEGSANNDYELQSGESSSGRIGIQFFANPKTTVDSSVSISETVSDIVAELEIYTAASKEGHGSIVKISSETKDNIAKLDSKQLLEVIKNTDVRYGMRTVMNSANSEQLNIVVNELISNSDTLISNPNFVRALSGNIDFNIYTSLVDSILSNSSAGNRLISTLSDAGIFELFNKYSENSNMLKRLFNNMSASQYRTIYIEYFDDQLSGTTISDLLESSISKELSNKQLGVIFEGLYSSENLDVVDFANEQLNKLGNDRINEMLNDGTLIYNTDLPPMVKKLIYKNINKSRDVIIHNLDGEYGVNQNAVGRNVSYYVTKPWVKDLNDFANFLKEANECSFASAYSQAVLCNTPLVPLSAGDRVFITRYMAINSDSYSAESIMEMDRDILKRNAKSEYRQLLNRYIIKGVDMKVASMIFDSIDATGACSYAAFANLIVDSYKDNPVGFKKDFGFDLYEEVNGKKQFNSKELMIDMFIFMNSIENGGKLFRYNDGDIRLIKGSINPQEQVYVSRKSKFNPCAYNYLASKNSNLKLNSSGVINAANMSKKSLQNAVAQALQSGKQLDMHIGRNLLKPVNFHGPLGVLVESTLTWSEGGAHAVYVTGMTDNAIIVSSWGKRLTIPFSNLAKNPNVAFIVTQLENMSSVSETSVDTDTTVLATDVSFEVSNSISFDTSNLDTKGVVDLLVSVDFDDNYDTNINQIFRSLSDDKFVAVVKYMNENSMFDCDMIGALDSKVIINKLEILYDKSPELISPFVDTIPGMMGSIIEDMFTNSSNINYELIETILNGYDSSDILTVVNDSPSLKNSLDRLPKIKEIYVSKQQSTLTSYTINETRLSVNLFTMDLIDSFVNGNGSIDIMSLLNDSTFNNDAITILLDKLAKNGKIDIENSIISSLDSGRLFEIINQSIMNNYNLTSVIDSLSTEQFVSFVDQLSNDSVKSFLKQVSLEKIVSVYNDLGLSGRYKLDNKFDNLVDMLDLSIYVQKVNDGSMKYYVEQFSDNEFNEFITEVLKNEVFGVTDLVKTIVDYDSNRISNMIENGILEFNDKLPEFIKSLLMEKANARESAFESTAAGTIDIRSGATDYTNFGIDQDITRKHVKFTVKNNSWMKSLDQFAEFIIGDAKRSGYDNNMTRERALELAKELSTPGTVLTFSSYDIITRYLANNYLVKDALKYSRDSFIRENSAEYKRVLDKISPYCKDVVTATKILDCINSTGVCSYAAVANVIFDYYKDIPDQFRKDFGFDLYIEIDGQKRINEIELLTDMYVTVNSDQMNGKLFRRGGLFGKGKLQTMTNLDTRFQIYMSNGLFGVDLDIFNKYLGLKNKNLVFTKNEMAFDATHTISSTEIKKMFVDGLRSGNYINLGISKTDKKIRFNNPDGSTYNSTFDWNEGGGHAVYVVGVTDNSVVVSSWGKKLLIPFEDLVDNKFRVSFLSKTDVATSPLKISGVSTVQQNTDSVVNYTVGVDGSSYSVSSNNSFKDKLLEKYYDSVLKRISSKANNSDFGYGTVSRMIEKSMGDYFKNLTSGSKIYEIMSSLNNKQMLFYAINNCDLSLLSNEQLQGIINRAVKNGYVLDSNSSLFVKSNPNIIMRLLQPDSYYFRKSATGSKNDIIFKNNQRRDAFREFVNSINYSALNSEQITEIIDIAIKNEYYISEKSPSFIRGNMEIISKVVANLTEKFQYNQTISNIDYSTLSDVDLLVLADCVGKSRFGISEYIPSNLRNNFEFIMQLVSSSADGSINSKLSGVDYSNFSDQQLLNLMRVSVNKGYVLDIHSPIERLNVVLENDVKTYLETISPDYKELLIPIIDRLGYSSVGIEGYNGIFSQDMLSRFGVDFVTDMYKYCNLTGSKVNFELLISNGQIDTFKQIFDSVLGSKYIGTLSDIKLVKKIFDKCISNSKLFEDILSSDINDAVISNLRKYVNSNFRIEVNSVDELMQYDSLVKSYVDNVIASGDINRVKDTISLLLFNASDGDMYDFNQTFGGTKKIDILVKKLGDSELCSILKGYSVLLKFYQNKVASNNNSKALISICDKLNNMSYDDRMSYLKVFDDIDGFVRYCYGVEVNESLTKLDSIVGLDAKNIRVDGKYTWQDGNEFVSIDYVEINSNYRLFQHTLNAFGEGGKLSDYQSGRVVGKSYLCLSMIGDNKIGVVRETSDVDHVTLLFDSLVSQDLMACAPRDIGSGYRTENNELFINNRGSRFDIVDNILSDTSLDSYNEYVIYRNNAKPAGILVTGVEANNAEIEAAARLGVPLVKINYSGNEKISNNNLDVSTEFSESIDEFVGYLTGKNGYTITKDSPSGQIIYDGAKNRGTVIDTSQYGEYELQEGERLGPRVGIQYFAKSSDSNSKFSLKRMFNKNDVSIDIKVSELRDFINTFEDYPESGLSLEEMRPYSDAAYEIISKINKTDSKVLKSLPIDVIETAIRKGYMITVNTPKVLVDNIMTNSSDGKLLCYAIDYYDNLTDDPVLIHKVLDCGYVISSKSPKFIRENYEYVSKFINGSNDSISMTNFVNILNPNVFTEEQLSNIITIATKKGLVIDKLLTASYIKTSPKLIMDIVNNAFSLDLISSVIKYLDISTLSDSDMKQLVEIARDLGYKLDINSPIVELNRGLNLLDDQLFKSLDSDYRATLEELITKVGYIHVYFEGYDGIFSKEVIDLFGVDNVYQIYKYCNLVNIRLDFNELINRGELKSFKDLYDTIYVSNSIDSEFDILNFKRFISKYLSYDSIFHDIIGRNLSESEISSFRSFVRSSFDIKISSYEELLNYNNLVREYVLDVVNNGSIDDIKAVSSKLLFNQDLDQTIKFFRDVADSERVYALAEQLKDIDVDFSHILSSYGVLFDVFNKIVVNGSDIQRMKDFILAINNSSDGNISIMYEDVVRNIKYYYGLELNKTLTRLDNFVRYDGKFTGTKYSIDGNVDNNNTTVDYIEVNSKYRLLQHKLNYGVNSGGKLLEYLNPRLIGNTYLCLSLIGDNKVGINTESSSINEVTLLFDEIIPRNLLLCSPTDLHSAENTYNSLDVYANDSYRFDIAENILRDTSSDWWNEYTIYRENVKPSGILVTGDVPNQAEIDAAATLDVPLVKINYGGTEQVTFDSSEIHDAVSVDSSRKGILGISKNSMLEMKLANASSRSIDSMIRDGKLNEHLSTLNASEIYNGPLAKSVYQFANKMDLDAMGDSFVLLTSDQFDNIDDFMDSIDDDLSQGLVLSQESVDMMNDMSSEEIVAIVDKLLDNSEYFESAKQVVKYIDDSVLGQVFDRVMIRDDSLAITSYLDADQVVSLMDYYSEDSVSYDKFCRNVSYAKFTKVAKVLNEMSARGDLNAARMRSKLDRNIDARFVSDIRSKNKNGTLNTYLSSMSNSDLGRLFEKMIDQKVSDSSKLCDSMIEMIGQNKFNILVRNGYIQFDTRYSQKTQKSILDIINQQKDGSLKELSVYGVDQGYIRSHIRYAVKTNWSDDISDIAKYLSKNYGLGMFEAEAKALNLTAQGYSMDHEEHQMIIDYLSSKYGKGEAMRMASKIFSRKVDSRYVAALNKLVSRGTDIKTAQAILDCIDTTGVCSYASVANLIVDAYKDNPSQFKEDFGFDLYTYENGHKEINSTELLADMYIYINSNLCGGRLFNITNGRVTTNTTIINTENQVFLSSNQGFRSDLVNKYLHSKNPNVSVNVTSASQFYADGINSEVDNIKTAIVRAIQEGKQVTLGVYRTKGNEFKFLDENGVKRESTIDWSEGDGHAVYVTGVTDNGVVVSTWGKRRVIPFTNFINNQYRINFVKMAIDGSVSPNNTRGVSIYSNPDTAISDGRSLVIDGASTVAGLSDAEKRKIVRSAKQGYIKAQLGSDIFKYNQIYLQKGLRVKAEEFNIDRRKNKNKKLKLDTNAMMAARNQLSDNEAIKLGKKQLDIEADAYAQAVLDKAIETANSHVKNVSEESVDVTEENVQTQIVDDTTNQTNDVDNNNDNKDNTNTNNNENVDTDSNVDNNSNINTNNVNKKISLSKKQKAKIIKDSKKGYIKEQLKGVNKDEFYRNLGYEAKAREIQFNTSKNNSDKINKNALKAAKNLLTDADAIKLGKQTLEAQALEYAEKRVEDILAGNIEYKSKGSPVKKIVVTSVGAIVLLSYLGSIGDIPLDNDLLGDDILDNDEADELDVKEPSNDDGNGPTNPDGSGPLNPNDGGSDDIAEIIKSDVMEPNEDVISIIPQDVPVIESVIEEVVNSSNIGGQNNYVSNESVEIPNIEDAKLSEDILEDEYINIDEPYLIPMSSNYVDISDKKDVSSKGLTLGGMGLATLGALGTKLYLDKKKEDREFEEEFEDKELEEELEQENDQDNIELVDNNDEDVDSDYEVPIFYSDTLKDEE